MQQQGLYMRHFRGRLSGRYYENRAVGDVVSEVWTVLIRRLKFG